MGGKPTFGGAALHSQHSEIADVRARRSEISTVTRASGRRAVIRCTGFLSLDLLVKRTFAGALLHKSADGRGSPFPGQTYPTGSVTGMPSAV